MVTLVELLIVILMLATKVFLLADNALYVKADLQEGWGTENNLLFDNTKVLSVNGIDLARR